MLGGLSQLIPHAHFLKGLWLSRGSLPSRPMRPGPGRAKGRAQQAHTTGLEGQANPTTQPTPNPERLGSPEPPSPHILPDSCMQVLAGIPGGVLGTPGIKWRCVCHLPAKFNICWFLGLWGEGGQVSSIMLGWNARAGEVLKIGRQIEAS